MNPFVGLAKNQICRRHKLLSVDRYIRRWRQITIRFATGKQKSAFGRYFLCSSSSCHDLPTYGITYGRGNLGTLTHPCVAVSGHEISALTSLFAPLFVRFWPRSGRGLVFPFCTKSNSSNSFSISTLFAFSIVNTSFSAGCASSFSAGLGFLVISCRFRLSSMFSILKPPSTPLFLGHPWK